VSGVNKIDGMLSLVKADSIADWWLIERKEHDGRSWFAPAHGGMSFMRSARISDADVEGPGAEMLDIAEAIEKRSSESHRRCSVSFTADGFLFCSPRNSQVEALVSVEAADDLARQIRASITKEGAK